MLDFTSALYLGLEHPSWSLPEWDRLTLGKPAALEEVSGSYLVQRELAALTGCDQVLLGSSTLHLFGDLFAMLAKRGVAIWMDEGTYPIARWGADRAAAAGVSVRTFARHDARALEKALGTTGAHRPVIVSDGYCPLRGTLAPLREYARCAAAGNGLLVVDDTQALGIFGRHGGGALRHFDLRDAGIVVVSSLAKAFGAPLAMLGGSEAFVETFRAESATLVHCSPPSAAAISAAWRALDINRRQGDVLRHRLAQRVVRFRRRLSGLLATNSLFPLQALRLPRGVDPGEFYRALFSRGVRPVLHRDSAESKRRISFVLTTRHRISEIDRAVESVLDVLGQVGRNQDLHTAAARVAEGKRGANHYVF